MFLICFFFSPLVFDKSFLIVPACYSSMKGYWGGGFCLQSITKQNSLLQKCTWKSDNMVYWYKGNGLWSGCTGKERALMRTLKWEQDTPGAQNVGSSPSNWTESCPRRRKFPQRSPSGFLSLDTLSKPEVWRLCFTSLRWNGCLGTITQKIPQTQLQ